MNLKSTILKWRHNLMVLALYLPFFVVQCFFNYSNIINRNNENCLVSFNSQHYNPTKGTLANQKKPVHNPTNINLNKRFEPGQISFIANLNAVVPVPKFIITEILFGYNNPFNAINYYHSASLRGPPCIA